MEREGETEREKQRRSEINRGSGAIMVIIRSFQWRPLSGEKVRLGAARFVRRRLIASYTSYSRFTKRTHSRQDSSYCVPFRPPRLSIE